MKSLAELAAIRDKMKDKIVLRQGINDTQIVVAMGTCGIAAGARAVLNAFVEGVNKAGLVGKVVVSQSGCNGNCNLEPVVEVFQNGKDKVTYVQMTAEKVEKVLKAHIEGGKVVEEFTIGNAKKA